MKKEAFLERLRAGLNCLPFEEREDCMRYYEDYLTDAGDAVDEVLAELGSPEKIAAEVVREYNESPKATNGVESKFIPEIHTIKTDLVNSSVKIVLGDEYTLTLPEALAEDATELRYTVTDGALRINEEKKERFSFSTFFKHGFSHYVGFKKNIVITLPKSEYASFDLKTVSGKIEVSDMDVKTLKGESVNGSVVLKNIKADSITIKGVNGALSASDIVAENFKGSHVNGLTKISGSMTGMICTDCVNGSVSIELAQSEDECDWCLSTMSGSIYINGSKIRGRVEKTNGAKTYIKCSTVNGSVRMKTSVK